MMGREVGYRTPEVSCRLGGADRIFDFAVFDFLLAVNAIRGPRHGFKSFGADSIATLQAFSVTALVDTFECEANLR